MQIYTNMAWPGDPFRTGQQLYRRPAPRLAAFTVGRAARGSRLACYSAAIVYLPLSRTRALAVTAQTVTFGVRAASTSSEGFALAQLADLELMQARRHAAVLTGHMLAADLAAVRALAPGATLPGIAAVEREWADRRAPARGRAAMVDCGLDLGAASLGQACHRARIGSPAGRDVAGLGTPAVDELAVAVAVERALIIALVCARRLGRYTWEGTLPADQIMALGAWDCLPQLPASGPHTAAMTARQPGDIAPARARNAG